MTHQRASESEISAAEITNDFTTRVPGKVSSFTRGLVDVTNKATVAEASSLTRGRSRKGIEFVF